MRIDPAAAERLLAYADGDASLEAVWEHSAYDVVRAHAALLGRECTREDVERAMAGEETTFSRVADLPENRERVEALLDHVRANEAAWTDEIERQLRRVTPDADLSDVPVYLGVGYSLGVGLKPGAYLNLNASLFQEEPRELLATAVHESSHVVYERVHDARRDVGPEDFATSEGQRRVFDTVFHTEAFATYTPLALRQSDGALGTGDHPIQQDYAAVADPERLSALVAEYDARRESLDAGPLDRAEFLAALFGGSRLPYRVGCALVERIEDRDGIEGVREAFYCDPGEFHERYDGLLDAYRE